MKAERSRLKCVSRECEKRGVPDVGFDFFLCADCGAELEFWLEFFARKDRAEKN